MIYINILFLKDTYTYACTHIYLKTYMADRMVVFNKPYYFIYINSFKKSD